MIMVKDSDIDALENWLQEIVKDQVGFLTGDSEPLRLLRRIQAARAGYKGEATGAGQG